MDNIMNILIGAKRPSEFRVGETMVISKSKISKIMTRYKSMGKTVRSNDLCIEEYDIISKLFDTCIIVRINEELEVNMNKLDNINKQMGTDIRNQLSIIKDNGSNVGVLLTNVRKIHRDRKYNGMSILSANMTFTMRDIEHERTLVYVGKPVD